MMEVVKVVAQGCTINLPRGGKQWNIHMLGLVDDKRHYVNLIPKEIKKILLSAMELLVSLWNELLHFVGGALKSNKCAWYIITR